MGNCGSMWGKLKYICHVKIKKMSFVGNFTVKTDAKNRMALPAPFRKMLNEGEKTSFILQKDIFQNCLILYPLDEWNLQMERLRKSLNPYNSKHKRFKSQFLRNTAEISLDSGGRILLPQKLMQLVDITKEIEVAGADTTIEIWNKKTYEEYSLESDEFATLTEEILGNDNMVESL